MAMNLAAETVMPGEASGPGSPPLSPEEMQRHFPQFEILECLGRGGMGVVYKARQKTLERLVAIKVLAGEWEGRPDFATRFAREAKTLALLSHPNIVTVHDFGETDGLFYLVMEYVDGVNLRELLGDGRMEPEQALAIVPPVCDALEYAHAKGIVHRDIKPENLLLDRDGRVKIADFGIASLVGAVGERSGTPPYMAPEQQQQGRVDRRADIYALGVVLYEMLTGEQPGKEVVAPSRKVHIDVRLDEVVLRALEKDPELRFQAASVMRTQVETITGEAATPPRHDLPVPPAAPDARLSRTAVAGAAWACLFIAAVIPAFTVSFVPTTGAEPVGPAWWQTLLAFTLLPLGIAAPLGTTLLGWISVAQIRRSAGKLYGLGLAVFDGLLFPLLLLDILIAVLLRYLVPFILSLKDGGPFDPIPMSSWTATNYLQWALPTLLIVGLLDWWTIRKVWRSVTRPVVV